MLDLIPPRVLPSRLRPHRTVCCMVAAKASRIRHGRTLGALGALVIEAVVGGALSPVSADTVVLVFIAPVAEELPTFKPARPGPLKRYG
jgi:hypothetical protein